MIPENLRYTEQHEWVKVDGTEVTVGITDFAQQSLGDITFVELPPVGTQLQQGAEACSIESAKAASSVYAPADGKVTGVNEDLEADPAAVNDDPYNRGWIFKMQSDDPSQLDALMDASTYEAKTKE